MAPLGHEIFQYLNNVVEISFHMAASLGGIIIMKTDLYCAQPTWVPTKCKMGDRVFRQLNKRQIRTNWPLEDDVTMTIH